MKKSIPIKTMAEYVAFIYEHDSLIFRGQVDDWPLLPSIARTNLEEAHQRNPHLEKNLLERFRLNAAAYIPVLEKTNHLDWWRCMAIAQHHGLPTRLLGWTISLVALFFALERPPSQGDISVVYAIPKPEVFTFRGFAKKTGGPPWIFKETLPLFLQPDVTQPRIYSQSSVFSVHPGVPVTAHGSEVYEKEIFRIEIPKQASSRMARELYKLGIAKARLFPDPDAVSSTLLWEVLNEIDRLADDVLLTQPNNSLK